MERFIDFTVRLIQAARRAYARKWSFLAIFACIFFGSVVLLGGLDLLPQAAPAPEAATVTDAPPQAAMAGLPVKIKIPAIETSADIVNPTSIDVAVLDQELLKGAVRYPTSAKLGETGNVVLFGHSSYLPVVHNQAYKTFNGIQKLALGDTIIVYSSTTAYTYRVRSVAKESTNDAGIPLAVGGRVLTLSTCDSFGAKTDRFVVTADFVESRSVSI